MYMLYTAAANASSSQSPATTIITIAAITIAIAIPAITTATYASSFKTSGCCLLKTAKA